MNARREQQLEDEQENIAAVIDPKRDWRSIMVVLTAILNVITLLVFIFGGMNWITQVNSRMEVTAKQIEITASAVKELQDWSLSVDKRHASQDAIREYLETHPTYTPKKGQ